LESLRGDRQLQKGEVRAEVSFNDDRFRRHPHELELRDGKKTGETCLFDGYVAEEDNMAIAITVNGENVKHKTRTIYEHRFNGPPEAWVGEYSNTGIEDAARKERNSVRYRIDSIDFDETDGEVD
jgi:hypothetical protein